MESISSESIKKSPGFQGSDQPQDEDLYRCVHCGLCLSACPTYVELGVETESPRGRIALMKAVGEGRLGINQRVASHWEMCLGCRACEAVCPSGVPYGRLIESTRTQVMRQGILPWRLKLIKAVFLRGLLPRPSLLRFQATLLRAYQSCGLQTLLRKSRLLELLPGNLDVLESQLPNLSSKFFAPEGKTFPAYGERRTTVGLLSGCVMPLVHAPTMEASVRVLQRNGCDVVVPVGQGCCGALNLHSGDSEMARRMARRNIDIFLKEGVEKVVVASAGCGSAMKEYDDLLADDSDYSEKSARFKQLVVDITEFLAALPLDPPRAETKLWVTYQDPCHLAHAQRITKSPRAVLEAIPGVQIVEMENASQCCGAAGLYVITQREMSNRLLDRKIRDVASTGVDTVVTANPGCVIQLEAGLKKVGINGRVCHVVDLLDQAYRAEDG